MRWRSEFPESSEVSRHVSIQNFHFAVQIYHAGTKFSVVLQKSWRDVPLLCAPCCSPGLFNNAGPLIAQPHIFS